VPVFPCLAAVACAETPSHSRAPGNIWVRVRVSFTTGAVRSATPSVQLGFLSSDVTVEK